MKWALYMLLVPFYHINVIICDVGPKTKYFVPLTNISGLSVTLTKITVHLCSWLIIKLKKLTSLICCPKQKNRK